MGVPREQWLRVMGYSPWVLRSRTGEPDPGTDEADEAAAAGGESHVPHEARQPLLDALMAAAGAADSSPESLGWRLRDDGEAFAFEGADLWLNLSALRRTPSAKRALWRTLRALRRQRFDRG